MFVDVCCHNPGRVWIDSGGDQREKADSRAALEDGSPRRDPGGAGEEKIAQRDAGMPDYARSVSSVVEL